MKNRKANIAVSEILGALLMLCLVVSSFSALNYFVISSPKPNPPPIVEITGSLRENQILLTHRGGEPLSLNTEILVKLGDSTETITVGDFLDDESKADNKWGVGEQVYYPIFDDFEDFSNNQADIRMVDKGSKSLIMTGIINAIPTCDLSVELYVDNLNPQEDENIIFTIVVKNLGNINASDVFVEFLLPEGLTFVSYTSDQGLYSNYTGIWDIGLLQYDLTVNMTIEATVGDSMYSDPTQFAILFDGSGSITPPNWELMLNGLSTAVMDSSKFPHNGGVELTLIQFGGHSPVLAKLEIGPIIITESNVESIANDIQNIIQIDDKTPTSCAILMAADVLAASDWFNPDTRQVILLVTDGNPTHSCFDDGDYIADGGAATNPKEATINARNYLINLLELNETNDEFNALAIELIGEGHAKNLKEGVVWPEPGYYFPDEYSKYAPEGGWVRNITTMGDFTDSINETFDLIFNIIPVEVNIQSATILDPKAINDNSIIKLEVLPEFL